MPFNNTDEFMGMIKNPLTKTLYFIPPNLTSRVEVDRFLLLETGDNLLLETGDDFLLENATP
jgi:hypothetical protein